MHSNKNLLPPVSLNCDQNDRDQQIKAATEHLKLQSIGDNPHNSVCVPIHIYPPVNFMENLPDLTKPIQYRQKIAVFHLWKNLVNGLVKYEFAHFGHGS